MTRVTSHKRRLPTYIIALLLFAIPLFVDVPNGTYEIIWLLYLIPPILITFHHGAKGGIITGIFGVVLQLSFEASEYFQHKDEFNNNNFIVVLSIAAGVFAVTLGMGTLLRHVERKQRELEKISQELEFLANHDALTSLPNRRSFERKFSVALQNSKASNSIIALIFCDLDRFKCINDTDGHCTGDLVICEVANRLKESVRAHDFLARFGGDEFTILLDDLSSTEEVSLIAQNIISLIERPITLNRIDYKVTASLGIALSPQDSVDITTLMKYADMAMYKAKGQGNGSYAFYTPQMGEMMLRQTLLEQNLKDALTLNQFTLFYQPLWDIKTERITSAEALIRWEHPELGLIPPNEFIPLAEETGFIVPIGEWVLYNAIKEAQKWHSYGHFIKISVNISSIQLQRPNCMHVIQKILAETGFNPKFLEFEITERVTLSNPDEILKKLIRLRSIGIQIAIDDFGTGYSSLSYLKKYPIDSIKIDRAFIQDIANDPRDNAMLEALLLMAKSFNFDTVAEGVETSEQLEVLEKFNCHYAQGYHLSRPLRSEDFLNLIISKSTELSSSILKGHLEVEKTHTLIS